VTDDPINPYFAEPEPHPNPSLGCIRRGICCRTSPGWFAPGEVDGLIEWWNGPDGPSDGEPLDAAAFIRRHLIIDWYMYDGERVDVFAPVKLGRDGDPLEPPSSRATDLYGRLKGRCTFFDDATGCRIYAARPYECRKYVCTNHPDDNPTHREIARMWKDEGG
jgi:Fe-S-cluster containining protein